MGENISYKKSHNVRGTLHLSIRGNKGKIRKASACCHNLLLICYFSNKYATAKT